MANNRRGGIIEFKIDGQIYDAKGNFTYGLGINERTAIVGADGIHGYSEKIMAPFIEGEITDSNGLSLDDLGAITDSTITLTLANGKVIMLSHAWSVNKDGMSASTDEGNIPVKFEGQNAQEIR